MRALLGRGRLAWAAALWIALATGCGGVGIGGTGTGAAFPAWHTVYDGP